MRRAGVTFLASPPNLAATMTATSAPFPRSGRKGTLAVHDVQTRTMPREHSIDVCLCEVFGCRPMMVARRIRDGRPQTFKEETAGTTRLARSCRSLMSVILSLPGYTGRRS